MSKKSNKNIFKRIVRNIVISAVIILVVIVSVGIIYTWYMGNNSKVNEIAPIDSPETISTAIVPTQPAENVRESAAVELITSPIIPGSNASITIKTNPGSDCTISVIYNKIASTDTGLVPKAADDWGTVSWSWTVASSVPLGKWPVEVTCVHNELSAFVRGDLEVVSEIKD